MQVKWLARALANLTDEADYIAKERACKLFCVNADGTLIGDRAADYQIQ
jgi:hypothetical protein